MIAAIRLCDVCLVPLEDKEGFTGDLEGMQFDFCVEHANDVVDLLRSQQPSWEYAMSNEFKLRYGER